MNTFDGLSEYARKRAIAVSSDMPVSVIVLTAVFADIANLLRNNGFTEEVAVARKRAEVSPDVADIALRRMDERVPFTVIVERSGNVGLRVGDHAIKPDDLDLAAAGRARRYVPAELIEDIAVAFIRETHRAA